MRYNPSDWYWVVAGDQTHVYASARAAYVPVADTTYVAWLAAGNRPSRINTEASLHDVLDKAGVAPGAIGTVQQRATKMLQGCTVTLTSTGTSSLNGVYVVDPAVTANLTALQSGINAGLGLPGGGSTLPYNDASNVDHEFTAAQFTAFAVAVRDFVFNLSRAAQGKLETLPSTALTIA